jgi:hypothetical protein
MHVIIAMIRVRSIYASNALCPVCSDQIVAEIVVSQRCALRQHSCKILCSISADQIVSEFEVSQHLNWPRHKPAALPSVYNYNA